MSAIFASGLAVSTARADIITFIPGTYNLAQSNLGPVVDTLTVSIVGAFAQFTVTGADNASFSLVNNVAPNGYAFGDDPYFGGGVHPVFTFYTAADGGGFSETTGVPPAGANIVATYAALGGGTAQVFTVPEPASIAVLGFGLAGIVAGRRKRA